MKKKAGLKIRISLLVLWLCSFTAFAYAVESEAPGMKAGEDSPSRSVSALESEEAKDEALSGQVATPTPDFRLGVSPLSSENKEAVPGQPPVASEKPLSEREIGTMVDNVLSRMAEAGLGEDLSQALTYISSGDYASLVDFQKENPEILNELISSIETLSGANSQGASSQEYVNHWLEAAKGVREQLIELQSSDDSSGSLVGAVAKLYRPIAERVSKIANSLEEAGRVSGDSGEKEPSSDVLLKNFSSKAKKFILNSFSKAQANLADGMLSSPLEATAFAAETTIAQTPSSPADQAGVREMTLTELYVKSREYRVVDSVYIGKDFIYAQKMLHPPANLHPYLKWLLYTRNLTPRMVEHYLATREAVGAIYGQAKAGQGNIRYKGKVYGAFLPFAETAAGNYELVKPASAE